MASLTGSTTAVFFVRLSTAVDEIVDVDWNTRDGTAIAGQDYEAASGTMSFIPGETEKSIDVVVYGQDDVSADGKKFYIELKPPVNAVLTDAMAECVITVADEDGVLVTSLVIAQGKRGLKGDPGLSAYEQAVLMGHFTGTVEEWMEEEASAARAAERAAVFASAAASAATAANIAGKVYPTASSGVAAVLEGEYFNVRSPSDDQYLIEYQKIGGSAVATGKSYPTAKRIDDAAASAEIDAGRAEAAAEIATLSGKVFETPEAGVDPILGVPIGAYFNVRSSSDESYIDEYQNVGGSAVATGKSYPSGAYVKTIAEYTALPFKVGKRYALHERVQLAGGDIVKSTVAENTANPNMDMTGWYQAAPQSFGTPAKAVNVVKGLEAPTVVDYFDGYFWGTSGNDTHKSADGETWELFSTGQSFTASRMIPTSDKEVLALDVNAEKIYKSVGWSTGSPTWKLVLTNPYAGSANPILRWGFDGYKNKFIVTHYGSGTPNYVNSRYVWISTDAGETFSIVYDTQAVYPDLSSGSHIHAACYDKWADRFYFSEGHGTPHGIYYSDDNGLNWTKIPNVTLNPAPTTMTPTDFGIVLGLDSEPNGTGLLPRSIIPDGNDIQLFGESLPTGKSSGVTGFADRAMRDPYTGIVYVAYNSSFADVPVVIFAVGSGGASIVLREGFGDLSIKRFSNVVVAKGKLLATHNVVGRIKADIPPYTSQSVPFDTGNVMPEVKSTRLAALAVGRRAVATGLNSLAVGGTTAHQDSIAIGFRDTVATGALSVVIGTSAKGAADSTVVGFEAESAVGGGTAIGFRSKSSGAESTAVGRSAQSLGVYALTVGRGSKVEAAAAYGIAIGADSSAKASYCLSIGYSASTTAESSTAIGSRATAVGGYSTALGDQASSGYASVSVGRLAVSSNYSVSLGHGAKTGINSIAVGYSSEALQQFSVAIGDTAKALSSADVVIGRAAKTIAGSAPQTVLGTSAESNAAGGVAIGNLAKVNVGHANSVAIGSNSETQRTSSLSVGDRDLESTKNGGRLILKSPNGTTYAISVSDTGVLTAVAI